MLPLGQQWHRSTVLTALLTLVVTVPVTRAVPCAVTASARGEQQLQCSHRRMTKLPDHRYDGSVTVWLDMSFNNLTSLTGLNAPRLRQLRHLIVNHNQLTSMPADVFGGMRHLQVLDLGYNDLRILAEDTFRGLGNLTVLVLQNTRLSVLPDLVFRYTTQLLSLDVSGNPFRSVPTVALQPLLRLQRLCLSSAQLRVLGNHSLSSLHELRELFLDGNGLTSLQPAAFSGLDRLVTLSLASNQLILDHESYPPGVFKPLASLQDLELNDNDHRVVGDYPLNVFAPLPSLRSLSIDTFRSGHFGEAFSSLTRLPSLTLAENGCDLKLITNDTFAAFRLSRLNTLNIYGCTLAYVESCAFCHLPSLAYLKMIGWLRFPLSYSLRALYGLQNQSMETVDFSESRDSSIILDETNTAYLNNICVKTLVLRKCSIVGMHSTAFQNHGLFLQCLQHIDLSENDLSFIPTKTIFRLVATLSSLQSFHMENQHNFELRSCAEMNSPRPTDDPDQSSDVTLGFYVPRSLKSLKMSAAIRNLSQLPGHLRIFNGGNLTYVDMSYSGAYDFRLSITGVTSLYTLDLSGNDCYLMSTVLFQNLITLRFLRLAATHLNGDFLLENGTKLLRPLADLEELDLSKNNLLTIHRQLLHQHSRLQRLSLAGNRFQTVPVDLPVTGALAELDMSSNMMTTLSASLRHDLDRLADRRPFLIRLRGNPFSCTCDTLDMIDWLGTTAVRLDGDIGAEQLGFDDNYDDNGRDYPCVREDGSRSSTGSMFAQREGHWRRCVGLGFLAVSVGALLVQLLGLLLVYVLWRNWTYVKYTWHVLRRLRLPRRGDFQHHALLVHADRDLELAMRVRRHVQEALPAEDGGLEGLKVELPIEVIPFPSIYAEELAKSIQSSWRIVVMVTANFLQDQWSGLAVHQAQLGVSDTMPHRVLLLYMMQDPHDHHQPDPRNRPSPVSLQRLVRMLPESNVFHVPIARLRRRRIGGDGVGYRGGGGNGAEADERRVSPGHPAWATLAQRIAKDH